MTYPISLIAAEAPLRKKKSLYPPVFAALTEGRHKRPLGDLFGLTNFGVNFVRLEPGARSSMRHGHSRQDELIYVISGTPTLYTDAGPSVLQPGAVAGFKAGSGDAHCLINESAADVEYLEIGDRSAGDTVIYPDDDLAAILGDDGQWRFTHKDGSPY